jgi:hypothetical protein
MLLRALAVGLAIPLVCAVSLAAQEPRVIPPNAPPLSLPVVYGDNEWLRMPQRLGRPAFLRAQVRPTEQQEQFTPISELPPEEQLAAAPLLVGAYAFVLAVLFGYLVMVARRLSAIERDISRLAAEMKPAGRS